MRCTRKRRGNAEHLLIQCVAIGVSGLDDEGRFCTGNELNGSLSDGGDIESGSWKEGKKKKEMKDLKVQRSKEMK